MSKDLYLSTNVVIIGAGPAGLTAGYQLCKSNVPIVILESDPHLVGGISKTVKYKGYCFDIGGHRFFSKSKEIEDLWTEMLPDDFLVRQRSSRIFYNKKFFSYPLKVMEALFKLGVFESIFCVISYLKFKIFPIKNPISFQDWVTNNFGERLFNKFFKTYTEKVWGMGCKEISADWAAQRIKGLSLSSAIWNALGIGNLFRRRGTVIKTLIKSFRYPRQGPGMLWENCADRIVQMGGILKMGFRVNQLQYDSLSERWLISAKNSLGDQITITSSHVVSSAPLRELLPSIQPVPECSLVAQKLKYRDFLTVALILEDQNLFNDNWIYVHDPAVKVGRIQNFKSWSSEMVPDQKMNCYGLEYFCFEGDGLWSKSDIELIELAKRELCSLGLSDVGSIKDGCVVRQVKAYPVYDDQYDKIVDQIRTELAQKYPGLHLVGRNGMHKYNNQDHSMMTAILTAKNIINGRLDYDVWAVNQETEYHETDESKALNSLRFVPSKI